MTTPNPMSWLAPAALPRLTLLLNHVVSSEPLAMSKLKPHAGKTIELRWSTPLSAPIPAALRVGPLAASWTPPTVRLAITPAGLFEWLEDTPVGTPADTLATAGTGLVLTVQLEEPLTMLRRAVTGERPDVSIEGNAALAEVASWMMKNLRWDVQDDVARWLGTTPAEGLRRLGDGIRQALSRWQNRGDSPR